MNKKVIVFGASGKTGSLVVEQALSMGYNVIAYVRKMESLKLEHPKLKIIVGHLNEKEKLKTVITGSDACISTLGGNSLTRHSLEIIQGINNIIGIMEEVNVLRFIYLSSFGAGESRGYMPQPLRFLIVDLMLRVPLSDHNSNEMHITKSELQWTIVRPGGLTNGAKTGNLKHGFEKIRLKGNGNISRANVAAFLLDQVINKEYINKSVWLYE